jgi:hypothetical protein
VHPAYRARVELVVKPAPEPEQGTPEDSRHSNIYRDRAGTRFQVLTLMLFRWSSRASVSSVQVGS